MTVRFPKHEQINEAIFEHAIEFGRLGTNFQVGVFFEAFVAM